MRTAFARFTVVALAVALLSGCNTLFRTTRTVEQSTAHAANAPLKVDVRNGAIEVIGDATAQDVHIVAQLTAGGLSQQEADSRSAETQLSIIRDTSGTLTVTVIFPGGYRNGDLANLTVRVPDVSRVDATTGNGAVSISNLDGDMIAKTGNGRITLAGVNGKAALNTSNGRITVENHTGDITATTSNGAIELTDIAGRATARTSNGAITVKIDANHPGPIDLQTHNGRITATVGNAFAGQIDLSTSNGTITVEAADGAIASKDIKRRSGKVEMTRAGEASRLKTSNGGITLKVE